MIQSELSRAQRWAILGGAAVTLSLAMGMRQSLGLFQSQLIGGLGITAAQFSLAIATQNIVWGVTQPFVGMLADRRGVRPVMLAGVALYAAGLLVTLAVPSAWTLVLGAGVCIGVALSCTASSIAMAVTSRTVPPEQRSAAMGVVSAIGSVGLLVAAPIAQSVLSAAGWQAALLTFVGLAVLMLPAALAAGTVDRVRVEAARTAQSVGQAVQEAARHPGYVVMAAAYFVCGLQLVFLTTHLPTYLVVCGMDPALGAQALALIGLFNAAGSYLFGWLGGRHSKRALLGGIYVLRSLIIIAYFSLPPTPTSTLVFAAAMGTLWLGVVPLVNGLVIHLFGLRYMATLSGIAFFSHQMGSFVGAFGGGLIYGALGSYEWAWKGAVAIGLAAGLMQMMMNVRPSARVLAERAASAAMPLVQPLRRPAR